MTTIGKTFPVPPPKPEKEKGNANPDKKTEEKKP